MNGGSGFTRDNNEQEHHTPGSSMGRDVDTQASVIRSQTRTTATSTSPEATTAPRSVVPFEIDQGIDSSPYPLSDDDERERLVFPPSESFGDGVNAGGRSIDRNSTIDGDEDAEVRLAHHTSVGTIMAWAHIVDYPIVTAESIPDEFRRPLTNDKRTMWTGFCIGSLLMVFLFSLSIEWESGNDKSNGSAFSSAPTAASASNEPAMAPPPSNSRTTATPTSSREQPWMFWIQSRMPSISFDNSSSLEGEAFKWLMEDPYTKSQNDGDAIRSRSLELRDKWSNKLVFG